jgi:hypothetical protein
VSLNLLARSIDVNRLRKHSCHAKGNVKCCSVEYSTHLDEACLLLPAGAERAKEGGSVHARHRNSDTLPGVCLIIRASNMFSGCPLDGHGCKEDVVSCDESRQSAQCV